MGLRGEVLIDVPYIDEDDGSEGFVQAQINLRPHLIETLDKLRQYFQIVIFTASEKSYADSIIDFIDPKHQYFDARLYRDSCIETSISCGGSSYLKDLRIIGNRKLEDLILVDNAVLCFALQLTNGVPILPFFTDKQDDELLHLNFYLESISECDDVRIRNRDAFNLEDMLINHEQQFSFLFDNSMNYVENNIHIEEDDLYRTPDHGIDADDIPSNYFPIPTNSNSQSLTPRTSKAQVNFNVREQQVSQHSDEDQKSAIKSSKVVVKHSQQAEGTSRNTNKASGGSKNKKNGDEFPKRAVSKTPINNTSKIVPVTAPPRH